jgi:hypothetical protein
MRRTGALNNADAVAVASQLHTLRAMVRLAARPLSTIG